MNSISTKSQEAILKTESTQHLHKAVHNELDVNHEIPATMTEGFTNEPNIVGNKYVGSGDCLKGNTPSPDSSVQSLGPEVENNKSQVCLLCRVLLKFGS